MLRPIRTGLTPGPTLRLASPGPGDAFVIDEYDAWRKGFARLEEPMATAVGGSALAGPSAFGFSVFGHPRALRGAGRL